MKTFTPFSDDIVFFDAEFTSLDIHDGEILSFAMLSLDGQKELYCELPFEESSTSDWVKENVLPHLSGETISRKDARKRIRKFCGSDPPFLVATVNQYDMAFWHKLFAGEDEPIHTIPIDFASILFSLGLNPAREIDTEKANFYQEFGIDITKYNLHNALDDVKLMRELYVKLSSQ